MYNLLITAEAGERTQGTFYILRSRFLEHTSELISTQLGGLSVEAVNCIKSWPCILMQEGRGDEKAYISQVTGVELADANIKLVIASIPNVPPLINDTIWKVRADLDIQQYEFNRHHWAIKDRDIFPILAANGHPVDPSVISRFRNKPLPAPPRSALISAIDVIAGWGHSDIDRFLLEAGVKDLIAGREIGSRQDRANAIIAFAVNNPSATTAENSLFSAYMLRRTKPAENDAETVDGSPSDMVVPEPTDRRETRETRNSPAPSPNRVFVVHGQNEMARSAVVSFLSKVGLHAIVLHEQPSMGRHLLTKFVDEAELVTFAVVLMTDDDVGGRKNGTLNARARQNVILELGYFLSHLGQGRVCALITPGLETPSDFAGIVYIQMDERGHWQTELERELKAADMPLSEG